MDSNVSCGSYVTLIDDVWKSRAECMVSALQHYDTADLLIRNGWDKWVFVSQFVLAVRR